MTSESTTSEYNPEPIPALLTHPFDSFRDAYENLAIDFNEKCFRNEHLETESLKNLAQIEELKKTIADMSLAASDVVSHVASQIKAQEISIDTFHEFLNKFKVEIQKKKIDGDKVLSIIKKCSLEHITRMSAQIAEFIPMVNQYNSSGHVFGLMLRDYCQQRGEISVDVVKKIIALGADIEFNKGHPLQAAINYDHYEVASYLLSLGADINADDKHSIRHIGSFDGLFFLVENNASLINEKMIHLTAVFSVERLLACNKPIASIMSVAKRLDYESSEDYLRMLSQKGLLLSQLQCKDLTKMMELVSGSAMTDKKEVLGRFSAALLSKF